MHQKQELYIDCVNKWAASWQNQQKDLCDQRPPKTQISLGVRPVWSESSLGAHRVAEDSVFLHADSEDSDQTGRMPRLIWVFAGRRDHFIILSWGSSNAKNVWLSFRFSDDFQAYFHNSSFSIFIFLHCSWCCGVWRPLNVSPYINHSAVYILLLVLWDQREYTEKSEIDDWFRLIF